MRGITPLGGHELLLLLVQFGLLLLAARALGEVAARFRLPSVVGELLAGFVLGPTLLGQLAPGVFEAIFPQDPGQFHLLEAFSWFGVILLLVLTGIETDVGLIARKGRKALGISVGGIIVPFGMGVGLGFLLPGTFLAAPDQRVVFALFVGTALGLSAIPVIAKVLMEMNLVWRDIGQLTLAAGMVDDVTGWILLGVVTGLAQSGEVNMMVVAQAIGSVLLVLAFSLIVGRRLVSGGLRLVDNHIGGEQAKITFVMVLALFLAAGTHLLHLEAALGAFVAGVLVGQVKRFDASTRRTFENMTLGVFAPVFFAEAGLRVDLTSVFRADVLPFAALVMAVAIVGKFVGAFVGAKLNRLGKWEALSIGAGMNARGAIEIIVATIGLNLGVLRAEMYAIILTVAVATSLMAPPLLRWTLRRVEMSEEERERREGHERRKESFIPNLKRVLIPMSGDNHALAAQRLALTMLGDEDVEVTILELRIAGGGSGAKDSSPGDLILRDERPDLTERIIVREVEGLASDAVVAEAAKGYDLVVLGANHLSRRVLAGGGNGTGPLAAVERVRRRLRREGAARAPVDADGEEPGQAGPLFDEFVDRVIQQAPCPAMVLSADAESIDWVADPAGLREILLPVWGTASDQFGAEIAFAIAKDRDATVHLMHAHPNPRRSLPRDGTSAPTRIGEELVAHLAQMGEWAEVHVQTEVVESDDPERAVCNRARRDIDLIVLETARSPVTQRAFLGHHVDYVLHHAPCPVALIVFKAGSAAVAAVPTGGH
ncbi:MAG: cation:proton antiporter [Actinomycetota bacterium]